jgi:hypothetical protein
VSKSFTISIQRDVALHAEWRVTLPELSAFDQGPKFELRGTDPQGAWFEEDPGCWRMHILAAVACYLSHGGRRLTTSAGASADTPVGRIVYEAAASAYRLELASAGIGCGCGTPTCQRWSVR